MNYAHIKYNSTANGPGVRTNLFVSGCSLNCEGCFNFEIQDYKAGNEFTEETMQEILDSMKPWIAGLSILGGDPTANRNIKTVTKIAKRFKEEFPDKSLWVWSGFKLNLDLEKEYTGEPIFHSYKDGRNPEFYYKELFQYVDVLVDGRWEIENYDVTLKWAGSTNQRVIDLQRTLDKGEIILYTDNKVKKPGEEKTK